MYIKSAVLLNETAKLFIIFILQVTERINTYCDCIQNSMAHVDLATPALAS